MDLHILLFIKQERKNKINIPTSSWLIGNIIFLACQMLLVLKKLKRWMLQQTSSLQWHAHVEGLPIYHNVSCMSSSKAASLECLEWLPTEKLDTHPHQ